MKTYLAGKFAGTMATFALMFFPAVLSADMPTPDFTKPEMHTPTPSPVSPSTPSPLPDNSLPAPVPAPGPTPPFATPPARKFSPTSHPDAHQVVPTPIAHTQTPQQAPLPAATERKSIPLWIAGIVVGSVSAFSLLALRGIRKRA